MIDGCPAGISLTQEEIQIAVSLRSPGKSSCTSPRIETDQIEILSGVFEGKTTGTPLSILIPNRDADSSKYDPIKELLRPGHANYTYFEKYGIFDYRGGGRASARETACRVAAGAVAKKLLDHVGINLIAYLKQVGSVRANIAIEDFSLLRQLREQSSLFCPDLEATNQMISAIEKAKEEGDSLGGIVEFCAHSVPIGLGDPVYEKLEANLAHAMMGIPATKGFEIGSGFQAAVMHGSDHNDLFYLADSIKTKSNHAGGILGGISNGMPIIGRVAFKPPSSIKKAQKTVSKSGEETTLQFPEGSRHDPCVAIRAVPVVESMVALVLADHLLLNRSARL